jgi:hypothetical protein
MIDGMWQRPSEFGREWMNFGSSLFDSGTIRKDMLDTSFALIPTR